MKQVKNGFISAFQNDYKLLFILTLPALALCAFGLSQLGLLTASNLLSAEAVKLICEFLFLGVLLSACHLCGLKNKWILSGLLFFYYVIMTADMVLLLYFKERFGAKYLQTMEGGDYDFLADWRVISYFLLVALFCFFSVRKFFQPALRKTAFKRLVFCLAGLLLLWIANPLKKLPAPNDFYTSYLISPSLVYTANALLSPTLPAHITAKLSAQTAQTAQRYQVFNAKNTGVGKQYKRVILVATESWSNKYLHRFNPQIPPKASQTFDTLFDQYPSAALKHVTLSTLYGLSVIFTSHPFAQLAYSNGYPTSIVRLLKDRGYKTAFLRGANEKYMDENILFEQAGFEEVIGKTFFETQPAYAPYLDWWGLTDRKLFEYATTYLQTHKKEPVFLTLLTVDSHVPLGRTDYLGQEYEDINAEFYNLPTLPRAFARYGQDVKHFLTQLDKEGLFDQDTLLLLTADHPSYSNTPTNTLFKPYRAEFDTLPFIIITRNKITRPMADSPLISQLDIAPTLLDLLDIEPPAGFFGHSLFDTTAQRSIFDIKEDYAVVTTANEEYVLPLRSKKKKDQPLLRLMTTFLVEE